jgi:hypothetical protein
MGTSTFSELRKYGNGWRLSLSVRGSFFFCKKCDFPFLRLRWRHELPNRVEHNLDNTEARSN